MNCILFCFALVGDWTPCHCCPFVSITTSLRKHFLTSQVMSVTSSLASCTFLLKHLSQSTAIYFFNVLFPQYHFHKSCDHIALACNCLVTVSLVMLHCAVHGAGPHKYFWMDIFEHLLDSQCWESSAAQVLEDKGERTLSSSRTIKLTKFGIIEAGIEVFGLWCSLWDIMDIFLP